ncbi:nucleotidyltransferase domain-containing protein [Acidianus sp. RZ1]|uniref:nucleotidyltransferase domain-containing protein n=1 Tax=Acidianus sp. RZ1 TaxID=1540082 RepID=UPI0035303F00
MGSIASGKYTVRSDIDILIVIKKDLEGREKRTFKVKVLELAFDKYNLPFGAPAELHVVNPTEAKKYLDKPFVKTT